MKTLLKFFLIMLAVPTAMAQGINITDEAGSPGTSVPVTLEYTAQNNLRQFQVAISYDDSVLTPQTTTDMIFGELVDGCLAMPGGNWDGTLSNCNSPSPGTILLTVSTGASNASPALDTAVPFGTITFDVDGGAPLATTFPISISVNTAIQNGTSTNNPSDLSTDDGSITLAITGDAGFASTPSPGSTVALGSGEIGVASSLSPELITVSEVGDQTLDVTALTFSGTNDTAFSTTTAPFMITDGGADVDVDVSCTPDARGALTATLELTNNSVNAPNAQYDLTCSGLSPNVAATPLTVNINGVIGAPNPTGSFDVTNAQDGFTSDALNAALAESGTAEISITDGLTDATISVDETDEVVLECDTTAAGMFSETITLTYDDPLAGGGMGQIDVTVNCDIANAFPVYESAPTPGSTLPFGTVTNGTVSAPLGVDVGNSGAVGGADLNVTAASITGANAAQFDLTFAPFTIPAGQAPDGTADLSVTCSPDTTGAFTAALTVNTDDPAEPMGGFTYDLTCEGESDGTFVSDPAAGGTLSLGVVPPLSITPEGFIDFSNTGAVDNITVDCSVTDIAGVFVFTPDPIDFTIAPGGSESVGFQCTPTSPDTFTANVACTIGGDPNVTAADFSVVCQGQPLVIPTMSRWGLVVMSLMLLLVAGVAGRRMLA